MTDQVEETSLHSVPSSCHDSKLETHLHKHNETLDSEDRTETELTDQTEQNHSFETENIDGREVDENNDKTVFENSVHLEDEDKRNEKINSVENPATGKCDAVEDEASSSVFDNLGRRESHCSDLTCILEHNNIQDMSVKREVPSGHIQSENIDQKRLTINSNTRLQQNRSSRYLNSSGGLNLKPNVELNRQSLDSCKLQRSSNQTFLSFVPKFKTISESEQEPNHSDNLTSILCPDISVSIDASDPLANVNASLYTIVSTDSKYPEILDSNNLPERVSFDIKLNMMNPVVVLKRLSSPSDVLKNASNVGECFTQGTDDVAGGIHEDRSRRLHNMRNILQPTGDLNVLLCNPKNLNISTYETRSDISVGVQCRTLEMSSYTEVEPDPSVISEDTFVPDIQPSDFSNEKHLNVLNSEVKSLKKPRACRLDLKIVRDKTGFTEDECSRNLSRKKRAKGNINNSNKIKEFRSRCCKEQFSIEADLNQHTLTHTSRRAYKCDHCGKSFGLRCVLYTHMKTHLDLKYACEQCGKPFYTMSGLKMHLITHTGLKAYACNQCGRSFGQKSSLKSHLIMHSGKKMYSCEHCGKSFVQKGNLITHLSTHSEVKSYECEHCGKLFSRSTYLQVHMIKHSGIKRYTCDQCGKSFGYKSSLAKHMITHYGIKSLECVECGKLFVHKSNLRLHLKIHTGVKRYGCVQCGKRFLGKPELETHMITHTGLKPYTCELCSRSFGYSDQLRKHVINHSGVKPYTCDHCGKSFGYKSNLISHLKIHTSLKAHVCVQCGKRFREKKHLHSHMMTHICLIKSYACEVCEKRFAQSDYLKKHMITHRGTKSYACELCGKSFTHSCTLRTHSRIHSGLKPYQCQDCGKLFRQKPHLDIHLQATHLGLKPYRCEQCGKSFSRDSTLYRHLKYHSGVKPFCCQLCGKSYYEKRKLSKHINVAHAGKGPYAF